MKLSRDEFERLALEQVDVLYRVARRLTSHADQVADLVQETYLRALRAANTFDMQEHGIRPWLVRILQNVHFSRAVRDKRQPTSIETAPLESGRQDSRSDPYPAGSAGWDGMDERLVRALNDLPVEYRVVLLLWSVEEFSYKEIAESLEIPIGTVMSRLYRARQQLGEKLHGFAIEEGVIRE
jgi:RNA polymerase sigma-70 factor (ECF subfamily)